MIKIIVWGLYILAGFLLVVYFYEACKKGTNYCERTNYEDELITKKDEEEKSEVDN